MNQLIDQFCIVSRMPLEMVVRFDAESRLTLAWSSDSFQAGQSPTHQHFPLSIMTIDGDKRCRFLDWT